MAMADALDANEYLLEYLASIDNLAPEVKFLFTEIENKDKEIEELQDRIKLMQERLWNLMDNASSDSEESEEDDDDEDDPRTHKRRLHKKDDDIKSFSEQELKNKIQEGYKRSSQLSDEKIELATKAVNLVKRHMKRMEDDFVALFPAHRLANMTPNTNGDGTGITPIQAIHSVSSIVAQSQIDFDSLSGRSPGLDSEDSQFSLPLLPNPQNGATPNQPASLRGRRKFAANAGRKQRGSSSTGVNTPQAIKFRIPTDEFNFTTPTGAPQQQPQQPSPFNDFSPTLEFGTATTTTMTNNDSSGGGYHGTEEVISTSSFAGLSGLEPRYCYCNQVSFGEMIGCDGEECVIEWFHIQCTGLDKAPKGKWFCRDCRTKNAATTQPTKKRKRGRPAGSTKTNMPAEEFLSGSLNNFGESSTSRVGSGTNVRNGNSQESEEVSDTEGSSASASSAATSPRYG